MPSTAHQQAYGNSPWGAGPGSAGPGWGPPPWWSGGAPFWTHPDFARPAWIAATVLAFIFWWPVGLALLFYLIGSGRMGCRSYRRAMRTDNAGSFWPNWANWCGPSRDTPSSGNRAFDEYRTETLRRLEEEAQEFTAFLERLRMAKDKSEFDQFMAERRQRPSGSAEPGPQPA